mmetsp:Transcript_43918/g.91956  ORF Transcript_43918/g.91956 Transcript_43918/m.91956 type:complete len:277 (+) Transcript_43918:742-1572(+)
MVPLSSSCTSDCQAPSHGIISDHRFASPLSACFTSSAGLSGGGGGGGDGRVSKKHPKPSHTRTPFPAVAFVFSLADGAATFGGVLFVWPRACMWRALAARIILAIRCSSASCASFRTSCIRREPTLSSSDAIFSRCCRRNATCCWSFCRRSACLRRLTTACSLCSCASSASFFLDSAASDRVFAAPDALSRGPSDSACAVAGPRAAARPRRALDAGLGSLGSGPKMVSTCCLRCCSMASISEENRGRGRRAAPPLPVRDSNRAAGWSPTSSLARMA